MLYLPLRTLLGLPWWFSGKESACNAGDIGSILGSGRSSGEGNGSPLQYCCLGNPMDRRASWAMGSQTGRHDWVTSLTHSEDRNFSKVSLSLSLSHPKETNWHEFYRCTEINSANNLGEFGHRFIPCWASTWEHSPANTLISALFPEQGTQLSKAPTPNLQEL